MRQSQLAAMGYCASAKPQAMLKKNFRSLGDFGSLVLPRR